MSMWMSPKAPRCAARITLAGVVCLAAWACGAKSSRETVSSEPVTTADPQQAAGGGDAQRARPQAEAAAAGGKDGAAVVEGGAVAAQAGAGGERAGAAGEAGAAAAADGGNGAAKGGRGAAGHAGTQPAAGGASGQPSSASPVGGGGGAAGSGGAGVPGVAGAGGGAPAGAGAVRGPSRRERSREVPGQTESVLEPETADAEALAALSDWSRLPLFSDGRYQQQSSRDRNAPPGPNLDPMFVQGNRDLNNFMCKSAEAELGDTHNPAQIFDAQTCTESYVRGAVIARYEGSGVLRRLWLTSTILLFGGSLTTEMLRMYVDDNPRPLMQLPLSQVMSGEAGELFAPPFGAGSRTFIAWYYPVVFGSKLVVSLDRLQSEYYYQTDVVLDRKPRPRVAPAERLPARDRAIQQLKAASPVSSDASGLEKVSLTLTKGQSHETRLDGPATVEELKLRVSADKLKDLSGVRIAVTWDDAREPAVELPLLELFSAAHEVVERSALALAANMDGPAQVLSLRLPMPFAKRARWRLEQTAEVSAAFELEWTGVKRVPEGSYGQLHTRRDQVQLPAAKLETVFAQASRRGRFVGLCADLAGHADPSVLGSLPLYLLEGDIRATADDKLVLDGTGTEDYPDNSFYFLDSPKATPFAQSWAVSPFARAPGQASFCRWQVLGNELDFQSSFEGTFEIAPRDTKVVDLHRTVAFMYLAP